MERETRKGGVGREEGLVFAEADELAAPGNVTPGSDPRGGPVQRFSSLLLICLST